MKRSTIVARMFYHTAQLLLAQINPYYSTENLEMAELQSRHSQMICGIAAHVKDRGVASVAIRSLAHAAEVLTDRREQEEVLEIFSKINKETGWRIGFVYKELKEKWGWNEEVSPQQFAQTHTAVRLQKEAQEERQRQLQEQAALAMHQQGYQNGDWRHQSSNLPMPQHPPPQSMGPPSTTPSTVGTPSAAPGGAGGGGGGGPPRKLPQGIPNPMYAKADFNLPQHPYQNFYVAPNHSSLNQAWQPTGGLGYYGMP